MSMAVNASVLSITMDHQTADELHAGRRTRSVTRSVVAEQRDLAGVQFDFAAEIRRPNAAIC